MGLKSSMAALGTVTDPGRSYWSAVLLSGKEVKEQSLIFDLRSGGFRPLDWTLDIVSTGDIYRIKEVSLHCPPLLHPTAQIATIPVEEPGTVFQLKIASMSVLSAHKQVQAHIIGKVFDKVTGECFCYIYDREQGLIKFMSSVYDFGSWRAGILPLGRLSLDVLGLRL